MYVPLLRPILVSLRGVSTQPVISSSEWTFGIIARFGAVKLVLKPTTPCHEPIKLNHHQMQNPKRVVFVP